MSVWEMLVTSPVVWVACLLGARSGIRWIERKLRRDA